MVPGVLVLLSQIAPVGTGRVEQEGTSFQAYDIASAGPFWVVAGEASVSNAPRAFAALFHESTLRCTLNVPEIPHFGQIFPESSGFFLWGTKSDTLFRFRVDTLCSVVMQDTLILPVPGEAVRFLPPDTVMVLKGDSLFWITPTGVVDSVILPSGVYIRDLLPLPDGSVGLVGWMDAPEDTTVIAADGWVGRLDRAGSLLFADTLKTPAEDELHRMVWLPETGALCVAGMVGGDGYVAWYTPSGIRIREARIGSPPGPLFPAWEWSEGCFLEEDVLVFPGWKSLYGFPDASPFFGVDRPGGQTDTVSLDLPFAQTTGVLPPLRLGPWYYGFVRNIMSGAGRGAVEYAIYADTEPPEGYPLAPDTVLGDVVWLALQVQDAFSGVDSVEIRFRHEGDSGWTVHVCRGEETCGVMVSLPENALMLEWYARAVDHAGNARRFPDSGVWTVVRVGVGEGTGLSPAPEIRVIPGGLRYRLPPATGLVVRDLQGRRILSRRGDRGVVYLEPGIYILQVGDRNIRVVIFP